MTASSLFNRRLLIFSGKGGVGKSTATAAFAVAAARRGKRVLVVEFGEHEAISRIFGAPPSGYAGSVVYQPRQAGAPAITSMCITAREALREYGMRSVKFQRIYDAVFDNSVVRYFTAAAPGLQELNLLGKIESLQREVIAPVPNARYDIMLLDAPATGHAIAFLEAPQTAMRLAQAGPIYKMIERMWQMLTNPSITALNIVSLPEEMPVNESLELRAGADALRIPPGLVVINAMYPDAFPEGSEALDRVQPTTPLTQTILATARSVVARRQEQDAMAERLEQAIPGPSVDLPLVICPRIGPDDVEVLADHLEAALAHA